MVLQNPLRGTSTIKDINSDRVVYQRGNSKLYLSFNDIEDVFYEFRSGIVTTNDLKDFRKEIFSSEHNGHGCHCTFYFMLLREVGLIDEIKDKGVSGSPYYIEA